MAYDRGLIGWSWMVFGCVIFFVKEEGIDIYNNVW